jgi:phosphate transport system protein
MNLLETELQQLRTNVVEMWDVVINQIQKAREVIESGNQDLVHEMAAGEKWIDSYELKNDLDCENLLALYNPLANDLRFVLAVLKINYNLERIADFAWGIGKTVRDDGKSLSADGIEKSNLILMLNTCIQMLRDALAAFEGDSSELAGSIFEKDKIINVNNKNASQVVAGLIKEKPELILNYLSLLTTIRKVERMGDHTKNIGEEIIFYLEAKVLRHNRKKANK